MLTKSIPFNVPRETGNEITAIAEVIESGRLAGNGPFVARCNELLARVAGVGQALITTSGTTALDMAALIAGIEPGDEVIIPSFTFVSTANAVVLRGGVPVFVDIREDTLNLDENNIRAAITPKTKAIVPVHYAGVGCEMDEILSISNEYGLVVIEDAAQAVDATYHGKPLGSFGNLGVLSFHQTKNISCGEGGALLINDPGLNHLAKIAWEKGTNRVDFLEGHISHYEWISAGSSYLPSEITAALLLTQLETLEDATTRRLELWNTYQDGLQGLEDYGVRRPQVPAHCGHNGHVYFILCTDEETRDEAIAALAAQGIGSAAHYPPLHLSPGGKRYGRANGPCPVSENITGRLLRLPLYDSLTFGDQSRVVEVLTAFFVR